MKSIIAMNHSDKMQAREEYAPEDRRAEAADYLSRAQRLFADGWMDEQYFLYLADLKQAVKAAEDAEALAAFADDVEAPAMPLCRTEGIPADPQRAEVSQGAASVAGLVELARRKGVKVIGAPRAEKPFNINDLNSD